MNVAHDLVERRSGRGWELRLTVSLALLLGLVLISWPETALAQQSETKEKKKAETEEGGSLADFEEQATDGDSEAGSTTDCDDDGSSAADLFGSFFWEAFCGGGAFSWYRAVGDLAALADRDNPLALVSYASTPVDTDAVMEIAEGFSAPGNAHRLETKFARFAV